MNPLEGSPEDRLAELLADRALQGLTTDQQAELDRQDDDVEVEALAFERIVAEVSNLLDSLPGEPLSENLRDRVERDAAAFFAHPTHPVRRRSLTASVAPWLGWMAATGLLLATGSGWFRDAGDRPIIDRLAGLQPVKLAATEHPLARGAGGNLVWSGQRQEGYLAIEGLAEVEADRGVYQLWIFDSTRDDRYPVDGGTFAIADAGRPTIVPIHPKLKVRQPTLFAVTLEPPGGVVVSDRKRIVLTASP